MFKVLLIEDAEESKNLVYATLGQGYEIFWAQNLGEASRILGNGQYDLVLLDVTLPDGDGFRFFSLLLNDQKYRVVPVIFLTAKDGLSDKVLGLSLGADDYIIKPFAPAELRARVEMRLKKYQVQQTQAQIFKKGDLEINLTSQRVFLFIDTKRSDLQLTPLEFKVLALLASSEDQVFSRDQLMDKIWGAQTYLTDRCIDTHIYSLRKKLGDHANYIQAVYGEGYRFCSNMAAVGPGPLKKLRPKKKTEPA